MTLIDYLIAECPDLAEEIEDLLSNGTGEEDPRVYEIISLLRKRGVLNKLVMMSKAETN